MRRREEERDLLKCLIHSLAVSHFTSVDFYLWSLAFTGVLDIHQNRVSLYCTQCFVTSDEVETNLTGKYVYVKCLMFD